ncbi:hypothetical protein C8R47DRAFT_1075567 [Mycena vitilis]|nr:hypothetical protein C8R47DRAFT_1075567 [Mycena vitilis]
MRPALILLLGPYVVASVALPLASWRSYQPSQCVLIIRKSTTTKACIPNEQIADTAPPWRRATPTAAAVIDDIAKKELNVNNKRSEPHADTAPAWRREDGTPGADTAPRRRKVSSTVAAST